MDTRSGGHVWKPHTGWVLALTTIPECSRIFEPLGAQSKKCRTGPTVIHDSLTDVGFGLIPKKSCFSASQALLLHATAVFSRWRDDGRHSYRKANSACLAQPPIRATHTCKDRVPLRFQTSSKGQFNNNYMSRSPWIPRSTFPGANSFCRR